jgi:predicted ATPase
VQITGIAGIGKSRLAWEFFKYMDGLAEQAWWHRGRCPAYGEGVAYWALAEMVRTRAGIVEGEEQAEARRKLAAALVEFVPDADERSWIEPRLANLPALEERSDTDRQDVFAAWRLFFERLADESPVVLVFEDLQWADDALLAFVEYLLEWSSSRRLYVLALSRPELAEKHPEFGRGVRNSSTLALEPMSNTEMAELLEGYVPGLPEEVKGADPGAIAGCSFGDSARARGRSPGRARARGAGAGPGRVRARKELHQAGRHRPDGTPGGRARAAARG